MIVVVQLFGAIIGGAVAGAVVMTWRLWRAIECDRRINDKSTTT